MRQGKKRRQAKEKVNRVVYFGAVPYKIPYIVAPEYGRANRNSLLINGRGGVIRTHDPLRPRQVRYQAALRPDIL